MTVHSVLRECAADLLETEPTVTVEQIVGCAYHRHGETFTEQAQQMVLASARTIVAKLMRDLTEDENEQLSLLAGLPSAIAVPTPDGTYYVRSDKATWEQLQIGRQVRSGNVEAALARLAAYDETLDGLRPYMTEPTVTVAAAVARMAKDRAAA